MFRANVLGTKFQGALYFFLLSYLKNYLNKNIQNVTNFLSNTLINLFFNFLLRIMLFINFISIPCKKKNVKFIWKFEVSLWKSCNKITDTFFIFLFYATSYQCEFHFLHHTYIYIYSIQSFFSDFAKQEKGNLKLNIKNCYFKTRWKFYHGHTKFYVKYFL